MQKLPVKMHVVTTSSSKGPDSLFVSTVPTPSPGDGELLIKVHAAGINGADLRQREGKYPLPVNCPETLGLEVSGEIVALGQSCKRFKIGDKVCALLIGGGYAEYAIAPEGQCMEIPSGVSLIEAAGLPEVFCTVWTNVMDSCSLKSGESILIQGGTSGIGYAAIKLAKAFGATVFATARNEKNVRLFCGLGQITQLTTKKKISLQWLMN